MCHLVTHHPAGARGPTEESTGFYKRQALTPGDLERGFLEVHHEVRLPSSQLGNVSADCSYLQIPSSNGSRDGLSLRAL